MQAWNWMGKSMGNFWRGTKAKTRGNIGHALHDIRVIPGLPFYEIKLPSSWPFAELRGGGGSSSVADRILNIVAVGTSESMIMTRNTAWHWQMIRNYNSIYFLTCTSRLAGYAPYSPNQKLEGLWEGFGVRYLGMSLYTRVRVRVGGSWDGKLKGWGSATACISW